MTREEIILCRKALVAFLFMVAAMCLSMLTSCSNEDEMFDRETTEVLPSVISEDRTLYTDTEYLISKPVFVTNGATLTIQRGALLKALPASGQGKATIVITKGCKIVANGTEDAPIVMTALIKEPGSWDGVIVLGRLLSVMSVRLYIVELLLRIFLMEVLRRMMIPVPYSLSGWSTPVPPAGQ